MLLKRDDINFPKKAVFKSPNGQYFIRSLVNNFIDSNNQILQFYIMNLWEGKKIYKKNLHPLIVLPTKTNSWAEICVIKNEDLYLHKPLLLNVNLLTKICKDKDGNAYKLYSLAEALEEFSRENDNIKDRLDYKWKELKEKYCEEEVEEKVRKEDEFSNFLRLFLDWRRIFSIDGKDVIDVKVISSGGPDVELVFSGGTAQKLELEHLWNNYLLHQHHINGAFKNVWIFAEEKFDFEKILKLFSDAKKQHNDRVPDVFLCVGEDNVRHAFKINWEDKTKEDLGVTF